MPRKKRNLEQIDGRSISTPPENYIYKDSNIRVIGIGLNKTPNVWIEYALTEDLFNKTREWLEVSNIVKGKTIFREEVKDGQRHISNIVFEWIDIIIPLHGVLNLRERERKDLFKWYMISIEVKLKSSISAIKKARNSIINDHVNLPDIINYLNTQIQTYEKDLIEFKDQHKRTGKHKFIYDLLIPLIDKLVKMKYSQYKQEKVIDKLFEKFECDTDDETYFIGRVILREYKRRRNRQKH